MPLCTLEIPKVSPVKIVEEGIQPCNIALNHLLEALVIPNLDDREIRIIEADIPTPRLIFSFTVGPCEYPGFEPEAFFPTTEQIRSAGKVIQNYAKKELGVVETIIEAWENTTFIIRDPDASVPNSYQSRGDVGSHIGQVKIRLVLSPDKVPQVTSPATKESEPLREDDPYLGLIGEICRRISEALGIPEDLKIQTEISVAKVADCNFSVEFDCQPEPGYEISGETRLNAAHQAEQLLNQNSLTQEGSAEIWVRQGNPQVQRFS